MDTRIIREPAKLAKITAEKRLTRLEERYRHEALDVEERCELRDLILRLRRRLDDSR